MTLNLCHLQWSGCSQNYIDWDSIYDNCRELPGLLCSYIGQKHIPCETKQNKQKSLASNQSAPLTKWTSTMIHLWHRVFIEFGGNHYLWLCARDLFIGLMSWISQTMRIQVSSLNRSFEKAIETGTYLSEHSTIAYGEGSLNHSTLQVFTPLAYIQMRVHK